MKKVLIVVVIILIAGFIYYSRQNFFQKNRVRRDWENQIESITGMDVDLRDSLRRLEQLEDGILEDGRFQNAIENLSDEAMNKLEQLEPDALDKLLSDLEDGAENYQDILEEHLD